MDDGELEIDNDNGNEEQEQEEDNDDSQTDTRFPEVDEGGWIQWFCQLDTNSFLCEISLDFLNHKKNLIGINMKGYLNMIKSTEKPKQSALNENYLEKLASVKEVYGLVHKRFIRTKEGLIQMREKYLNGVFGKCPRVLCDKQVLLPLGLSEDLKYSRVRVFCPLCEEVYEPSRRVSDIDGAYFGIDYPQFFFTSYPDLNPRNKEYKRYIPKVHGFKIFGKYGSKYYNDDKRITRELLKKLKITNKNDDYEYD